MAHSDFNQDHAEVSADYGNVSALEVQEVNMKRANQVLSTLLEDVTDDAMPTSLQGESPDFKLAWLLLRYMVVTPNVGSEGQQSK